MRSATFSRAADDDGERVAAKMNVSSYAITLWPFVFLHVSYHEAQRNPRTRAKKSRYSERFAIPVGTQPGPVDGRRTSAALETMQNDFGEAVEPDRNEG